MTTVFLVNGSTSPYNKPGDWADAGHQIELVGCGGQAGAASAGTSGRGGAGGGGGAYVELDYSSGALSGTTAFYVGISATVTTNVVATKWGSSSNAALTNSYYAENGRAGVTTTAGARGVATTVLNGTSPTPVYTKTVGRDGGNGGTPNTGVISGGAGGGGAGGPAAVGGNGGQGGGTAGTGGAGGGASNNGTAVGTGSGVTPSTASGTAGGTGVGPSHGGGAGSSSPTAPNGSAGIGGHGGGGGAGSTTTTASMVGSGYAGGPNGNVSNWVETVGGATAGAGGGGGGGGGISGNVATTSAGGTGGSYGGGGGGAGGTRGANAGGVGTGASGLIVIAYGIADAWNAADKSATVTLSNSDKTASTAAVSAVRSTTANLNGAAGKYYAEFLFVSGTSYALGLKRPAPSILTAESEAVYVYEDGSINNLTSGAIGTVGGAFVGGDVIGVAYDALTRTVWFRKNSGLWNNDAAANPATGTNGLPGPVVTATSLCLWLNVYNTAATSVTVRTEAADLTLTGPSGFTSWMGETLTPPADTTTVTKADVLFTGKSVTGIELGLVTKASVTVTGQTVTVKDGDTVVVTQASVLVTGKTVLGVELGAVLKATVTVAGKTVTVRETDVTPVTKATVTVAGQTVTVRETELTPVLKASVTVAGKSVTETELIGVAKATVTFTGKTVTPSDIAGADIIPVSQGAVLYTGKTVVFGDATGITKGQISLIGKVVLETETIPINKATVTVAGKTVTVREFEVTSVLKATVSVTGKPVLETETIPVNKATVTFACQTIATTDPGVDRITVDAAAVTFTGKGVFEREVPVTRGTVLFTGKPVLETDTVLVTKANVTVIGKTVTVRDFVPVLKAVVTLSGKSVTTFDVDRTVVSAASILASGKLTTVRDSEVTVVTRATVQFTGQTVTIPADASVSAKLVTSYTPGYNRQDFTGLVGMAFVLIGDTTFDQIGLRCGLANTGIRTVHLYDWATDTLLRSAAINLTGGTENQFYYTPITPITLVAGTSYALVLETTASDGQWWANYGPTTLRDVVSVSAAFRNLGVWATHNPDTQYVGVDLGYAAVVGDTVTVGPATVLFTGKTVTVSDPVSIDVIPIGPGNVRFTGQNVAVTGEITTPPPGGGGGVSVWIGRKKRRRYRALEEIEKRIDARIEKLKAETKVTQEKVAEVLSAPAHLLETEQGFEQLLIQQTRITALLLDTQRRAERVRQERIELARLAQIAAFEADEEEAAIMLLLT